MLFLKKNKLIVIFWFFLLLQTGINLIGALGPELSFDALWYHLTLPKLYLINKKIIFIPGGLLYYSLLPKLAELFYALALWGGGLVAAKLTSFFFSLACLAAIYSLLKKLGLKYALLGCLIFYSQLIVGWLATTCYVDLIRTFFEVLALKFFLDWFVLPKNKNLFLSSLMLGLAISVKVLAFFSLITFIVLVIFFFPSEKKLKSILVFLSIPLLIIFPWLVFAFKHTGNPLYPLFTSWFFKGQANGLNLNQWFLSRTGVTLIKVLIKTVFTKGDILSPLFLIGLPLVLFFLKTKKLSKIISLYFWLNFFFFFLTPLNYNRFLLPYFPAFIFLLMLALKELSKRKKIVEKIVIGATFLTAILNIFSRALANKKFLPVVFGWQTKNSFMVKYLNFKVGNFYDIDGWFKKNVKKNQRVLVIGVHNLYYLNFPFDHISWAKKGTYYDYILFQGKIVPAELRKLRLVYKNDTMMIKVYQYAKKW